MEELEGCLCLALEQEAAGSTDHLRLMAEMMEELEGCLCLALEEAAARSASPL
jgi:hypothetical protein